MECLKSQLSFHCLITGPTNCGKTRYLVDLLRGPFRHAFDFIVLICPTFATNKTYDGFARGDSCFFVMVPDDIGHSGGVDECLQVVEDLFHDNRVPHSGIAPQAQVLVVLDDCAVSSDVKKRTSKLIELAFSGRHKGISVWVLTQQLTSIAKPFRENLGCVVAFHNPESDGTDTLFQKFGSGIEPETKKKIREILKAERYSRVCFSLRHPFPFHVEVV